MQATTLRKIATLIPYKPWIRHLRNISANKTKEVISVSEADSRAVGDCVDPWAFIKAGNHISTIDASLKSMVPVIKQGIIAFNDCTDGTEEYVMDFCSDNKGFIAYKYPHYVYPSNHEIYKKSGYSKNNLDGYYNAALKLIPKNQWMIKIDCDHVYIPEKLKKTFNLPVNPYDCVAYSTLDLHVHNDKVYVIDFMAGSVNRWLIKNKEIKFKIKKEIYDNKILFDGTPTIFSRNKIFTELTNYHFPFIEKHKQFTGNISNLMHIDDYKKKSSFE